MKKSFWGVLLGIVTIISGLWPVDVSAQAPAEKQNTQTNAYALKQEERMFVDQNNNGACDKIANCSRYMGEQEGCAYLYEDLLARAKQLKLSEAQVKSLKHLADDSAQKRKDMEANSRNARLELCKLLDASDVDLPRVSEQIKQNAQAWSELSYSCVRNMIEVRNVLTPEQWNQWRKETGNLLRLRTGPPSILEMSHAQCFHEQRKGELCHPAIYPNAVRLDKAGAAGAQTDVKSKASESGR